MDMSRVRTERELELLRSFAGPDSKQLAAIRDAVAFLQNEIDEYGERSEKLTPWALVQWEAEPWVPIEIEASPTKVRSRLQKAAVGVMATKRMAIAKAGGAKSTEAPPVKLRIDGVLGDMSRTLTEKLPSDFTRTRLPGIPMSAGIRIEIKQQSKGPRKGMQRAAAATEAATTDAVAGGNTGSAGYESAFLANLYADCRRQSAIKPPPKKVEVKKTRRQRDAEAAAAAAAAAAEAAAKKPKRKLPPRSRQQEPRVLARDGLQGATSGVLSIEKNTASNLTAVSQVPQQPTATVTPADLPEKEAVPSPSERRAPKEKELPATKGASASASASAPASPSLSPSADFDPTLDILED